MATGKILVVEDEYIVAESLNDLLESLGYTVVGLVASGEDAIQKAAETHPDIVLMDIMLEGKMDGIEAEDHIRTHENIPVIFLTAYSDDKTLQRAKITEPFGYIVKPFKERELHSTIEISLYKYRVDQKLKENEQWLSTILKNIGDAVITLDTEKNITSMSPVAEVLTGWSSAEAVKQPAHHLLKTKSNPNTPSKVLEDFIAQGLQGESISCLVDQDTLLITKEHSEIPIDVGVAPILTEDGISGVILSIRDITERKKTEIILAEAQQMLANSLTAREKEILQLMVDGSTTKEIAYDLQISPRTVEAHRRNLMQKLDVSDIAMLIRSAITHKLVEMS